MSLVAARARGALLLAMCGALSSCFLEGGKTNLSRCGRSYVTAVYWGAGAGAVGAWYLGAGPADGPYYGDWYDPGDGYDPATNSGGITADPNSNDGSGWDQPADGSQGDPSSDPGGDPSADTGDSSGDSSGQGLRRLHLHGVTATPLPSASSSPPASSASPPPPPPPASSSSSPSASRGLAAGCYSCTMGCRTDATASPTGRQAFGVSDIGIDDACGSAVRTLAQWAHNTRRERIVSCQRIATR